MIPSSVGPIVNHLWQSTVFVAVAWMLTLLLRRNLARTRYWLWLVASAKFLIPFSLLASLGSHVEWRTGHAREQPAWNVAIEQISRPFIAPLPSPRIRRSGGPVASSLMPGLLFFVWACGSIAVLFSVWLRWRRIYTAKRQSSCLNLPIQIKVLSSPVLLEPAVFGFLRPVLLLPDGIVGRLSSAQFQAICAHELCHVRSRDNLAAAMHMVVEAIFWFHPIVWWLGARLVEERERACDEHVLQLGHEPQAYAEGILEVCRLYLESQLGCVAGVSGANLKSRIEAIMATRIGQKLNLRGKLMLTIAGTIALVTPILFGLADAPPSQTKTTRVVERSFETASIKVGSRDGKGPFVTSTPPRLTVKNATLRDLIRMSYHVRDFQITGGPAWIDSDRYVIDATARGNPTTEEWLETTGLMLQTFLRDRFKLKMKRETQELPVYDLMVAKGGLKLAHSEERSCTTFKWDRNSPPPGQSTAISCGAVELTNTRLNHTLDANGMSITRVGGNTLVPSLTTFLSGELDRTVIDKTGLTGLFDFHLEWNRLATARLLGRSPADDPSANASASPDASSPSLFAAVEEQLGLKLEPAKGPVEVLTINHVEKPSEN
jgi:bla regulator protein blaR1